MPHTNTHMDQGLSVSDQEKSFPFLRLSAGVDGIHSDTPDSHFTGKNCIQIEYLVCFFHDGRLFSLALSVEEAADSTYRIESHWRQICVVNDTLLRYTAQ